MKDKKVVGIRINGVKETTRYKGKSEMDLKTFLKRKHHAIVLADVEFPEFQLWYGGVKIAYRVVRFLGAGDTITFDVDVTSLLPEAVKSE